MKNKVLLLVLSVLLLGVCVVSAQDNESKAVEGGGVQVKGWTGKIDARAASNGMTLDSAKLVQDGKSLHVTTGPAVTYWNPKNVAKGDYMVSATFLESKYMGINDHPHPYGIMIGGNDLGTDNQSYIYCAAYGNGKFIVRGFGPKPFQLGGRAPKEDPAVNKAAGVGQPVQQEIGIMVKGDQISCWINKKQVATFARSEVVGEGKLKSTNGIYGFRFAHNTDATVTGLKLSKAK